MAFKIGEPISNSNPLPVTIDVGRYKPGEPISDSNPLPIKFIGSLPVFSVPGAAPESGELDFSSVIQSGYFPLVIL